MAEIQSTVTIEEATQRAVVAGLVELLQVKHLYQSVHVDERLVISAVKGNRGDANSAVILGTSGSQPASPKQIVEYLEALNEKRLRIWKEGFWTLVNEQPREGGRTTARSEQSRQNRFELPPIKIFCSQCKSGPWPHNPGYDGIGAETKAECFKSPKSVTQVFLLTYLCQNCRKEPVCFLVRREGLKLTVVGRSHFEFVAVPTFIPENEADFYRESLIALSTGRTLTALFQLRTFLEQYMRRAASCSGRVNGDELGEAYAATLPIEIQSCVPSLKKCYGDLSEALHNATADADLFQKVRSDVEKHLDARRAFLTLEK